MNADPMGEAALKWAGYHPIPHLGLFGPGVVFTVGIFNDPWEPFFNWRFDVGVGGGLSVDWKAK